MPPTSGCMMFCFFSFQPRSSTSWSWSCWARPLTSWSSVASACESVGSSLSVADVSALYGSVTWLASEGSGSRSLRAVPGPLSPEIGARTGSGSCISMLVSEAAIAGVSLRSVVFLVRSVVNLIDEVKVAESQIFGNSDLRILVFRMQLKIYCGTVWVLAMACEPESLESGMTSTLPLAR